MRWFKTGVAIAGLWLTAGLVVRVATGHVMFRTTGGVRPWWRWPWLHWCMFDTECQSHGCPRRLYVHMLGFYIDFE